MCTGIVILLVVSFKHPYPSSHHHVPEPQGGERGGDGDDLKGGSIGANCICDP